MTRNGGSVAIIPVLTTFLLVMATLFVPRAGMADTSSPLQESTPVPPPPGQEPGGPYYQQLYLARSTDGLAWQTDNILIRDHASVPALARWKGSLWIYVVDGVQHGLIVMRQDENGVWWETRTQIVGFDPTFAVDPDVVILPDGQLRLYFLDIRTLAPMPDQSPGTALIYSAVTSNGVHFKLEEGVRFQSKPPGPGTDPSVVQAADGSWWIFILHRSGSLIGHGVDGLHFEPAGESSTGAMSDTVLLDDGTLRQYFAPPDAILSQVSTEGLTWKVEVGERLTGRVGHPSVIREPDGSWLMAYIVITTPK